MKTKLCILFLLSVLNLNTGCSKENTGSENETPKPYTEVSARDYGAVGDGQTNDTQAIQAAIDDCAKGSGKVTVPEGKYIVSSLFLKSNVELHLEEKAELIAVNNYQTYVETFYPDVLGPYASTSIVYAPAMLFAENATNIKLTGKGTLNGIGDDPAFPHANNRKGRPRLISFLNCREVLVENVTLRSSAAWVQHYLLCDGVTIRGIKVFSFSNYNNDGIDIDSPKVLIENCYIESDDDGICLKSDLPIVCENVTVKNCEIRSNCNAIKLGTSSYGGFRNIRISDCRIQAATQSPIYNWSETYPWGGIADGINGLTGIAVESVDGGLLEDVIISNIEMEGVQTPIFIRLGDRSRQYSSKISRLRSVTISDVKATAVSRIACSITGVAEGDPGYIEGLTLKNIELVIPGGGEASDPDQAVPENRDSYPENRMFGVTLPGAGFYVRHIRGLTFENVKISSTQADTRPYYYFDDATGITMTASTPEDATEISFLRQKNSEITVDGVLYEKGQIGEQPDPDDENWLVVGENRYYTQIYDGLRWMVTNSKEGTPLETTYEGKQPGENGYYYDAENKTSACPEGWRLPTWDEALTLKDRIESDPQAENVKYWLKADFGAFAGQKANAWSNWGLESMWRLADRESDGRAVCVMHAKASDGSFTVEDGTTKTPRGFSVRCVKEEEETPDPEPDPNLGSVQVGQNTYTTYYYPSTNLEWMVTNSKEGTPLETTYEDKEPGENGYYYDPDNKTTACPEGWRLPNWDEALSLKEVIDADRDTESARYWTSAESGAFAGQKANTWSNWGLEGMWRLADRDGSKVCVMHSKASDNSFSVETGTTKTPRGFSVRCVRNRP